MKLKFLPLPGHVMKLKDVLVAGAAGWHPSSGSVGVGGQGVEGKGGGGWRGMADMRLDIPEVKFGLYRDDGLGYHSARLPRGRMEQIRKQLHALFRRHGLKITIENQTFLLSISLTWNR